MDSKRNPLKLKLYPPLKNVAKGVYLANGGNILKYKAKKNALSKPRNSHPSTTLTLQLVQTFEHTHKKDKTPPLEICNEVQEEFVVVHKKRLTKHGGQAIKLVLKPERIFKCHALPKPIIQEKPQHSGIGSHLFYLNMQHCNVYLSFNNIQLAIVLVHVKHVLKY